MQLESVSSNETQVGEPTTGLDIQSDPGFNYKGSMKPASKLDRNFDELEVMRTSADDISTKSTESCTSGFLNVKDNFSLKEASSLGRFFLGFISLVPGIGVMLHSRGVPVSNENRIVLHIATISIEGVIKTPLRRRDLKVLRRVSPDVRDIVLEAYQCVNLMDYEDNKEHAKRTYSGNYRSPFRKRLRAAFYFGFTRAWHFFGRDARRNIIDKYSELLHPYGMELLLVKREEQLTGTIANVYYLLFRNRIKGRSLP